MQIPFSPLLANIHYLGGSISLLLIIFMVVLLFH